MLQALETYGEYLWEGTEPVVKEQATASELLNDLRALRNIFIVNERAMFDFVVSPNSLTEVADKRDARYMSWGLDVFRHWADRVDEYQGHAFTGDGRSKAAALWEPGFGFLSEKDRKLLADAVAQECDAFLTIERKLPRNGAYIERMIGLKVLRPPDYWTLLHPWANLYV